VDQVKQDTLTGGRTHGAAPAFGLGMALGAIVVAALIGLILVLRSVSAPTAVLTTSVSDPFLTPAAAEFRAGERATVAGAAGDPFLTRDAADFRAGERALDGGPSDPLLTPNAIEFRAEERAVGR
jgi:hypothetical protein